MPTFKKARATFRGHDSEHVNLEDSGYLLRDTTNCVCVCVCVYSNMLSALFFPFSFSHWFTCNTIVQYPLYTIKAYKHGNY